MSDESTPEDLAMIAKWELQQAEADFLLDSPDVHTPTLDPDADDAA